MITWWWNIHTDCNIREEVRYLTMFASGACNRFWRYMCHTGCHCKCECWSSRHKWICYYRQGGCTSDFAWWSNDVYDTVTCDRDMCDVAFVIVTCTIMSCTIVTGTFNRDVYLRVKKYFCTPAVSRPQSSFGGSFRSRHQHQRWSWTNSQPTGEWVSTSRFSRSGSW